jgi:hypothetical protein
VVRNFPYPVSFHSGWNGLLLLRLCATVMCQSRGEEDRKEESAVQSSSTTIEVDLTKSVFQIAVSQHPGKVSESHRLTRGQVPPLVCREAAGAGRLRR